MTDLEKEFQKFKKEIEQRLNIIESNLYKMQNSVEGIERDIYLDELLEEQEDIIDCPYCNSEVFINYDENIKEIECPECHNTIELDWNGDLEDFNSDCGGHCSSCGGCGNNDDDEV